MKSNLEKTSPLGRRLNIVVPAEVVAATFDKIFKGIQKQANIKGFRQGKAPLSTIKTLYAEKVKEDVIQELVQKHYYKAVQEQKLDPITYPEFEFDVPSEANEFSFTANFDVKPDVVLKNYETLEIDAEKYVADEKKVDQVLENIRSARATLVDVLESRPAQMSDTVVIDFEGSVDGLPLEGGIGLDHQLELGSKQFIDGFEEGIVGMNLDNEKILQLKFPTPYHAKDLEGKAVEFKVKLKALKRKSLPELNDELVQQMMGNTLGGGGGTETKTLAELKQTIHKDIEQSEKKRIETDTKNRILKKLVELNPVDVPASMLADQKQALVDDMKKKMLDQGLSPEQFEDYTKKWDSDFNKTASDMIQSGFLVDAIAKKHDLKASKQDLEDKYHEYAKQTGIELDRIKDFYSRPEQENRLNYMITEEKVIDLLMKTLKINEVSAAKLKDTQG